MRDLNAHHSIWDCAKTDRAGRLILNAMEAVNACILNDHPMLLLQPSSDISIIDLVIASLNLAPFYEAKTYKDTITITFLLKSRSEPT